MGVYMCIYMCKALGGVQGRKQRSSLLTTSVLEPWLSPSPLVGFYEGDVVSGRQSSFFKKLPRPAYDEQLSVHMLLGGQELDIAVHCFRIRFMACISSTRGRPAVVR
jgi:hypothetical protein